MRLFKFAILAFAVALAYRAPMLFAQDTPVQTTISDRTAGRITTQSATAMVIVAAAQIPVIGTMTPASGARGSSVSVTLTGTDFEAGLTLSAGSGIAVTDIVVANPTSVSATFVIAPTAILGQRNVTVTTSSGTSGEKIFTVLPPPPTFTAITPSSGMLGGSVNVTLSGTDFVAGLTLNVGADITVRGLSVLNSSSATARLSIGPGAALGDQDFTLTTSGGTSGPLTFTVLSPPPPTLTGISPGTGVQNSSVSVTLSGTNFISGLAVDPIEGITVGSVIVVNSTTATTVFTIAADATLGTRDVTVTTAAGTSGTAAFSVAVVAPTLSGINPAGGTPGTPVNVTLTGTDFATGMTIEAPPEIVVSSVVVTSSSGATATFTIDAAATLGARDVQVTTLGGTSNTVTFEVLPPAPTLSIIDPPSGLLGMAVMVTLTGTNFYAPMTIGLGTDIAVSDINVIDSATATATLNIGPGAAPGLQNVTITTPGGTSSAALFSVIPFAPTLTGISPASAVQGTLDRSFLVTLTGTNLFDPTISIGGTGISAPPNVFVTSATTGTAVFTVAGGTAPGPHDVTITTAGGTSAPVTFTVLPPTPTLTSMTPAIGVRGTSVNVTISGTNFTAGTTTLNGIAGITITSPVVVNAITLTATLAIDANATLGTRSVTVTTGQGVTNALTFTVADPFPDLSITSSHSGKFGVGFDEAYTVTVANTGTLSTSGTITVSDTLPPGLTFVSGIGTGWSCSAINQDITCTNPSVLAAGASSSYILTTAVGTTTATGVNHTVSVASAGDLNAANDSATDPTTVAPTPSPVFVFTPSPLVAGEQATVAIQIPSTFPHDVTGTVTLLFIPAPSVSVDDPAIQFASGGRTVSFTIPANSTEARFGSATNSNPLGFQTGTVAGRLIFNGAFTAGKIQGSFSPPIGGGAPAISEQAPVIKSIETSTQGGFAATILLFSTTREVTQLELTFNTTPQVRLSCGTVSGCSVNGSTMTFDVSSLFAAWFASDTAYGSLSTLRLPFSIDGGRVKGAVAVALRNRQGFSNVAVFDLPAVSGF